MGPAMPLPAEDQGDDDDDEEVGNDSESPQKTAQDGAKPETKPAGKAKASPKPRGKAKAKPTADPPKNEIDPEVLKSAKDLGFESALRNLAGREELQGKSAAAMLKALQSSGGLVNKAKAVLMAGA